MNKNIKIILAFVLCICAIFGDKIINSIPLPKPIPQEINVEPSEEYKLLVKDIVAVDIEKQDAKLISTFFSEMADVVKNDTSFIKTTGQFRKFNIVSGGLNFNNNIKGKYPTLAESIDKAIVQSVGKEDITMDEAKRAKLVNCLNAVSWGVMQ